MLADAGRSRRVVDGRLSNKAGPRLRVCGRLLDVWAPLTVSRLSEVVLERDDDGGVLNIPSFRAVFV